MQISIHDFVDKGYLVVGQELHIISLEHNETLLLYVDATVVSCMHHNRIIQCDRFEDLATPLRLKYPLLPRILTSHNRSVYNIRQQYIIDFRRLFNIRSLISTIDGLVIRLDNKCDNKAQIQQQIVAYNKELKNCVVIDTE